jgi:hypothetical protein
MQALCSLPWFAWIPIVAIIGGILSGTIKCVMSLSFQHRERMAMIRMGMHPDAIESLATASHEKPAAVDEI